MNIPSYQQKTHGTFTQVIYFAAQLRKPWAFGGGHLNQRLEKL
jgi:hypothetical protein